VNVRHTTLTVIDSRLCRTNHVDEHLCGHRLMHAIARTNWIRNDKLASKSFHDQVAKMTKSQAMAGTQKEAEALHQEIVLLGAVRESRGSGAARAAIHEKSSSDLHGDDTHFSFWPAHAF
tara:strand:+ start:31792 stop:32151 length:360 start_codon:yes stop_codon:yes gene_type:complete